MGLSNFFEGAESDVSEQTPKLQDTTGKLAYRDEDIQGAISEVDEILGDYGKKRRGRKPKDTDKASPEIEALKSAGFDASKIEGTLVETYLMLVSMLSRCPLRVKDEQRKQLGPTIVYCANKYIPGEVNEHLPLIGLAVVTLDIVRESKKEQNEKKEKK